jgi:hypothetical protein
MAAQVPICCFCVEVPLELLLVCPECGSGVRPSKCEHFALDETPALDDTVYVTTRAQVGAVPSPYEVPMTRLSYGQWALSPLWCEILSTGKLLLGQAQYMTRPDVPGPEFTFFRTPLCDMKPIISPATFESTVERCANVVKWEQFSTSTCSVIGDIYHFAQLTSLVGPTTYLPEGKGILKDEGLRYGRCSHRYNMGGQLP